MRMSEVFLSDFDSELASTRKTLERVPEDKLAWKPHSKSMSMGRLAGHVAEIPKWASNTVELDSVDIAPANGPKMEGLTAKSRKEVLDAFDANVKAARTAIAGASDELLMKPWSLLAGGHAIFTMPRAAVLRNLVINHLIHHRAQLGVYLRLNDVPVPAVYGPSADEGGMMAEAKA
jgi:uncharacterized damage-inducible protein DinB